eukprot:6211495-Pleurochrysis_carterae.AAC.1
MHACDRSPSRERLRMCACFQDRGEKLAVTKLVLGREEAGDSHTARLLARAARSVNRQGRTPCHS